MLQTENLFHLSRTLATVSFVCFLEYWYVVLSCILLMSRSRGLGLFAQRHDRPYGGSARNPWRACVIARYVPITLRNIYGARVGNILTSRMVHVFFLSACFENLHALIHAPLRNATSERTPGKQRCRHICSAERYRVRRRR